MILITKSSAGNFMHWLQKHIFLPEKWTVALNIKKTKQTNKKTQKTCDMILLSNGVYDGFECCDLHLMCIQEGVKGACA